MVMSKVLLEPRLARLCFVSDSLCTPMAELNSDRDHIAHKAKNNYHLALHRKCLPTPALEQGPWSSSTLTLTLTLSLKDCHLGLVTYHF